MPFKACFICEENPAHEHAEGGGDYSLGHGVLVASFDSLHESFGDMLAAASAAGWDIAIVPNVPARTGFGVRCLCPVHAKAAAEAAARAAERAAEDRADVEAVREARASGEAPVPWEDVRKRLAEQP